MVEPKLVRVLKGATESPPPVWLMRQAGRYLPEYRKIRARFPDFLSLVFSPEAAAEVTLQPVRRFDFDAAILFSDILVVVDALGWPLRFAEGEGPVLAALEVGSDLERLREAGEAADQLAPIAQTVALVRRELDEDRALIGFAGGPWTVATYMLGGGGGELRRQSAYRRAFAQPQLVDGLLERLVEVTAGYLLDQIAAGADVIQIFESWAERLPEPYFRRWVSAPTARLVAAVKARHPDVPVIGFARGAGLLLPSYYADSGVDALGLEENVPIRRLRSLVGADVPLQGNLDPKILAVGGEAMRAEVARILDEAAGGPHVFNLAHGILKETPCAHVTELVAALRSAGR